MDTIGLDPIGWAADTVVVGIGAGLAAAYTAGQWLGDNWQQLIDWGPGAAPPTDPIGASQPPSAGEPSGFAPSPGYGGNQTAGPRPLTLEELITATAFEETTTGVSSPLGPNDPNQYQPIPTIPQNEDPQAPLTNGFTPTPQPMPPVGFGQNTLILHTSDSAYNPNSFNGYALKPSFKSTTGAGYRGSFNQVVASAVPELDGDSIKWTARVQAFLGNSVRKTWNFDAGSFPPSSGDFRIIFDLESFDVQVDLLNPSETGPGPLTQYFSLSSPSVPPQPPPPLTAGIDGEVPLGPGWPDNTAPEGFVPVNVNNPGVVAPPIAPPYPTPPTPQPVLPVNPVPTTVNNPQEVPQIGTNGLLLKLQELIKVTSKNEHKIGELTVNTGQIRPQLASVAKEVGRIEQKTAALAQNAGQPGGIGDLSDMLQLLMALWEFFESPISGTTYQLQGVCESVGEGEEQPIAEFPVPLAKNFDAIVQRLDVMQDLFQQHLAYRTPICRGQKRQGDFRTISFISDELSAGGKRRLDKRLRYRSQSGKDLGQLIDHWSGFTWQAGPVIVEHTDGWWGSIKVWASSIDEGKRVIRHAAGEAGIDPDQVGRWSVSGSNNPRYGLPGTMRVNKKGGYWWITARDGPDHRPDVGKDSPDI